LASAALLSLLSFGLLVSNGRPIGSGETRHSERLAASFVQEGSLAREENAEAQAPLAVVPAIMAAPAFALTRTLVALDEMGKALAGKAAASLFSALATGVLFLAIGRRWPTSDARSAALVFALGTSVWSTSQALWPHPAAVLFISLAILFWLRAEDDQREEAWAGRAGLPLGLALTVWPADVALLAVLWLGFAVRWPRRLPFLLLWSLPAVAFAAGYEWLRFGSPLPYAVSGVLRYSEPWGPGHLGLLVSPAKGLFAFTPVALVALIGLVRAFHRGERWVAGTLGVAALAHWTLLGFSTEWHGGECFGPRMMTDALPLLFLFLPDGWSLLRLFGVVLAALSIFVQALGAFSYDHRWERLYQRDPASLKASLSDVARNPIAFAVEERVLRLAVPDRRGDQAFIRQHPVVFGGGVGSRASFEGGRLNINGSERTLGDVFLEQGAQLQRDRLNLRGAGDGLFLRVREEARPRKLELRIAGRGRGTLSVAERSFWSGPPRLTAYPMSGEIRIRHPYVFANSGGSDLLVTLAGPAGEAALESVLLVSPTEPEHVIRLK
jgi:hypothetical protein